MVGFPWHNGQQEDRETHPDDPIDGDPILSCEFQDGTLIVYEDYLYIERASRSKFSDKRIAMDQVLGITYSKRIIINYLQIEQADFDLSEESFLTTPVDENTLHFGSSQRECARRAKDAVLERTNTR